MPKKPDPGPSTPSLAYEVMAPKWDKINTLLGGTSTMRAAGRRYLPQHEEESDNAWKHRLDTTTLLNILQMTVDSWVGRPFSEPIQIGEDVPSEITDLIDNIDLQGNNLETFCRAWFKDGLAKGFSHVYVDFSRPVDPADGLPRTLADDRTEKLRPYFVHIIPENVLFAHAEVVDGVERLTHIRIAEQHIVQSGWTESVVNRIRVIEPGNGRVFEEKVDPRTRKVTWQLVDSYSYDLPFIPLQTFYADRQGFMTSKPPLEDLADLNIRHWQSTSDQITVLTVARFPILGVSGAISDDKLTVGPHQWLHCPDPAGRFYYVEHSGKAIQTGRQDLLDLEEVMAEYGATFLKKRPGGASATARALDTAEVTSPLQDVAIRFQAAMWGALGFLGKWLKIDDIGTIRINTDFDFGDFSAPAVVALTQGRQPLNGSTPDISRHTYVKELHRMGVLGEDFDADVNDKELKVEQTALQATALANQKATLTMQQELAPAPPPEAKPVDPANPAEPKAKPTEKGAPPK